MQGFFSVVKVRFIGEGAVDQGGPRREFFRLLAINARDVFLQGKFFATNVSAVQVRVLKDKKICSQIFSSAIASYTLYFMFFQNSCMHRQEICITLADTLLYPSFKEVVACHV